jgi:GDP-mannose 4,6-dehydratase
VNKVLITGITGFVGSHLAEYLYPTASTPDIEVHGIKRWRSPLDNIKHILHHVHLHDADLTDLPSLIKVLREVKPDRIYHLAAQSYVPFSYGNPIQTLDTNIQGTANLLEAVRIVGLDPLIHICSSSEVYGQVEESEVPIKETQPFRPVSPYAVSKVGEDMLGWMYYKSYGMKIVRTRMFTHTGPRQDPVFVVASFAKQIAEIESGMYPMVTCGNLDSVRTICDVRDTVRAYGMLNDSMVGEVYNIGGDSTFKLSDLLMYMFSLSMYKGTYRINQLPRLMRPADVTLQVPDSSKFMKVTGWKPEISIEKTITDLLDYWRGKI